VIAWNEAGEGTGSLRSIAGVDIGTAVRAAVADGHLVKGGGHAMAAGLTWRAGSSMRWQPFMRPRLAATPGRRARPCRSTSTARCTPAAVTDEFLDLLERAGPYGQGNPQPRFAFPAHRVKFAKVVGEATCAACWRRRRLAPRRGGVPRRRPAGGRRAAVLPACRCTSPATCAATPGTAATSASSSSRTSPTLAGRLASFRLRWNRFHRLNGHPGARHRDPSVRKRRSERKDASRA
jgi:hypothetical protein